MSRYFLYWRYGWWVFLMTFVANALGFIIGYILLVAARFFTLFTLSRPTVWLVGGLIAVASGVAAIRLLGLLFQYASKRIRVTFDGDEALAWRAR